MEQKLGEGPKKLLESQLHRNLDNVEVFELTEVPESEIQAEQRNQARIKSGETLLRAVQKEDLAGAKAILATEDPDLSVKDSYGLTALHLTAGYGLPWAEFADSLVSAMKDVDARDGEGKTALHWAAALRSGGPIRAILRKSNAVCPL